MSTFFWGIYIVWLLLCAVVGFVWNEKSWLVIALPMAVIFMIQIIDSWLD